MQVISTSSMNRMGPQHFLSPAPLGRLGRFNLLGSFCRVNGDASLPAAESFVADCAIDQRKERPITASAYVASSVKLGTELANENVACTNGLSCVCVCVRVWLTVGYSID